MRRCCRPGEETNDDVNVSAPRVPNDEDHGMTTHLGFLSSTSAGRRDVGDARPQMKGNTGRHAKILGASAATGRVKTRSSRQGWGLTGSTVPATRRPVSDLEQAGRHGKGYEVPATFDVEGARTTGEAL